MLTVILFEKFNHRNKLLIFFCSISVAATSGNKTKAKVQKAYDQKENKPPKTQQQPQSQAQQAVRLFSCI